MHTLTISAVFAAPAAHSLSSKCIAQRDEDTVSIKLAD
jgi:hypothetical protein